MTKLKEEIWGSRISLLSEEDQKELLNHNNSFGDSKKILQKVYPLFGVTGKSAYKVAYSIIQETRLYRNCEIEIECDSKEEAKKQIERLFKNSDELNKREYFIDEEEDNFDEYIEVDSITKITKKR